MKDTLTERMHTAALVEPRGDLIGALAETVLDRPLSPLEHTAIDLALADAWRSAEVPILPMVVDRILSPNPEDGEGRQTARRIAARSAGARLDPPLLLALDEIGNLAPLPRASHPHGRRRWHRNHHHAGPAIPRAGPHEVERQRGRHHLEFLDR